MLVLTRNINEDLYLGPDIRIKILNILPTGVVKIGINAPKELPIYRNEVAPAEIRDHWDTQEEEHRRLMEERGIPSRSERVPKDYRSYVPTKKRPFGDGL